MEQRNGEEEVAAVFNENICVVCLVNSKDAIIFDCLHGNI